ncbi:MAG: hypothetical protein ACRDG3_10370 [Tepidiformaceae bacterium]
MADFAARVPVETEKSTYLHDRGNRPASPTPTIRDRAIRSWRVWIAIGLALGFEAMAFQLRDYWPGPRDWVVPVTTPLVVLGGLALGFMVARRQFWVAWPAILALVVTLGCIALNVTGEAIKSDGNTLAYAYNVLGAISLGVTVTLAVGGMLVAEITRPVRPPLPEG